LFQVTFYKTNQSVVAAAALVVVVVIVVVVCSYVYRAHYAVVSGE